VLHFDPITHKIDDQTTYQYKVPVFLRKGDFCTMYENRFKRRGQDFVPLGKWWLQHPKRRQFFGVVYKPGSPEVVDDGSGNLSLNLWTGWGVKPKPGDWSFMRAHIREVLAASEDFVNDYIIRWLAWRLQHPDRRPETAVVMLGKPGSGRGTLGVAMCRIFGNHALHLSSPDHLVGRFNAHQRQCSFLFADEAFTVEEKGAAGRLKRLITEPTLSIEAKGKDIMPAQNCLGVMMASNEERVVPAGELERRYVVQRVSNAHAQDAAWFEPLHKQLNDGGLAAMLYDLQRLDLGKWHPRQIIRTAALAEQQERNLSDLDAWWLEILQTGMLPAGNDAGEVISGDYDMKKKTSEGYDRTERRKGLYTQAREASPGLKKASDHAFGHYLSDKEKVGAKRAWVARQRGWQLPTLEACRAKWSERFPATVWTPDTDRWRGETVANWANGDAADKGGRDEPF
jgi:hypothetical protein